MTTTFKQTVFFMLMAVLLGSACNSTPPPPTLSAETPPPTETPLVETATPTATATTTATPEPPAPLQQISQASDGDSTAPHISTMGRWVVFASRGSNLVADDRHDCLYQEERVNCSDIFIHDRETGETARLSVASDGTPGNGDSLAPVISADGAWVAFASQADNLVIGDTNGVSDIFLHHRQSGMTRRISIGFAGTQSTGRSFSPHISADGQVVAFTSEAGNLVFGDTNELNDVFRYDHATGQINRVSHTVEGQQSAQNSLGLGLSADGGRVLFSTFADPTQPLRDVPGGLFLFDMTTMAVQQLLRDDSGLGIFAASLSADGEWVAFQQFRGHWDIFRLAVAGGEPQQISMANDGRPANFDSFSPAISGMGRYVAFSSRASNLVPDDENGLEDIFLHDTESGQTELISRNPETGNPGNGLSELPSMAADGQSIAFSSVATNLLVAASNNQPDNNAVARRHIYRRELGLPVAHAQLSGQSTTRLAALDSAGFTETSFEFGASINQIAINEPEEAVAVISYGSTGLYSLPDFTLRRFLPDGGGNSVAWSPDGFRVATANWRGSVPVWAANTGGRISLLGVIVQPDDDRPWTPYTAWSPQGDFVASSSIDEKIYLWHVISGTAEAIINVDGAAEVSALAWTPDAQTIAFADAEGVRLWELAHNQSREILDTEGRYRISNLDWTADGQQLAFGSTELATGRGLLHVWRKGGGSAVLEGHAGPVNGVAWSPRGLIAAGGPDGLWLWDPDLGEHLTLGEVGEITTVDWTADGRFLVAGTAEGMLHLWHWPTPPQ